jgi:uncharacterized protein (UPF0305 family)
LSISSPTTAFMTAARVRAVRPPGLRLPGRFTVKKNSSCV